MAGLPVSFVALGIVLTFIWIDGSKVILALSHAKKLLAIVYVLSAGA